VNGRHYWDGGIVSNSPLERAMERCGSAGKRVFIIDLFPGERRHMPNNLLEVISRRNEIVYSERIRNDLQTRQTVRDFQSLVQELMAELPALYSADGGGGAYGDYPHCSRGLRKRTVIARI
jgi:NTE family protein